MNYPPFVKYATPEEYRLHFERVYCRGPTATFDGVAVRFRKGNFEHDFFESSNRDDVKDLFSWRRAERIDWIKAALQDASCELYQGWDRKKRRYDPARRVAIVMGNYVVVIAMVGPRDADFVTAYVVTEPGRPGRPSALDRIRQGPKWT